MRNTPRLLKQPRRPQGRSRRERVQVPAVCEGRRRPGRPRVSEPNWNEGDTIALRDRIYRVYDVVYLDDDGDVRGMLMLEEPPTP